MAGEDGAGIAVLIIDDHRMFAEGLGRLLDAEDDISVVGIAERGGEGVALAARLNPAVVLVDHYMPDQDGVVTAAEIRRHDPTTLVVMLTGSTDEHVLLAAIEAGCSGYLTKDRAAAEVADAVRAAAAGEALISPDLLARLLPRLTRTRTPVGSDLTERELSLLVLMAEGATNKVIADRMYLSVNTVRNYVQSILTKLGAHSKLEAVATSVREGIIDYPTAR